jgi:hypothetical protein
MQNSMNYFDVNSPPISDLKHLIFKSISFSTISLYILKFSNSSDFFLRKHSKVIQSVQSYYMNSIIQEIWFDALEWKMNGASLLNPSSLLGISIVVYY